MVHPSGEDGVVGVSTGTVRHEVPWKSTTGAMPWPPVGGRRAATTLSYDVRFGMFVAELPRDKGVLFWSLQARQLVTSGLGRVEATPIPDVDFDRKIARAR